MLSLLIAGGSFGFQEMQKRQIVEKRATPGDPPPGCNITPPTNVRVTNIAGTTATLKWNPGTGGNYVKLFVSTSSDPTGNCNRLPNKQTDKHCVVNENGKLINGDPNHADIPAVPSEYAITGMQPSIKYYVRMMMWKESGCDYAAPIISFTTEPPSPSPSPSPSTSCVDLTKNKATPTMGDTVNFTCEANFTPSAAISPVAYFRYSTDNGATFTNVGSGVAVNSTTLKASQDVLINKVGDWEVQCRVCTDSTATACTAWGLAQ
ncbi:MAG: hypothetical protein UW37_C0020G0009 [Candidatus Gottesmanbacteria bacterium GW2011_GWA2_44_17]|uniref:Fibronectin type-III domain-containing protein n=1 Tax=Candidatus Gottesmanbacteria bacterium GW2011_GWA2_44_17 TaxID=1618444 RepID=A0A0G1JRV5_9BACT|nr:MAG: hypothetical protein UW37_C0020G0009 [Candidatus Gottesmanbacteria bacterium GW2011_GWA2_44_17]